MTPPLNHVVFGDYAVKFPYYPLCLNERMHTTAAMAVGQEVRGAPVLPLPVVRPLTGPCRRPAAYLRFAWGLTSEYLSGGLSAALRSRLQLPEERTKRSQPAAEPPAKRARGAGTPAAPLEDYSQPAANVKKVRGVRRPGTVVLCGKTTGAAIDGHDTCATDFSSVLF